MYIAYRNRIVNIEMFQCVKLKLLGLRNLDKFLRPDKIDSVSALFKDELLSIFDF